MIFAMACGARPTSPTRVSLVASRPVSPGNGAMLLDQADGGTQTVQLIATPATASADTPITYTFYVTWPRADFTGNVFTQRVTPPPGTAPTMTFTAIVGVLDYYWRVQASAADATAPVSDVFTFNVGFGIAIKAPVAVSPDHGSVESVQPTLSVTRASYTGTIKTIVYVFDVSLTPAFDRIAQSGSVGDFFAADAPVAVTLPDRLATSTTYYWRARAFDARTLVSGPNSATATFVTRAVALQPPILLSPARNEPTTVRPTLTVVNAPRVGPVGTISYRFDLATDSSFKAMLASDTVVETPVQTSLVLRSDLPSETVIYWRATATDAASGVANTAPGWSTFVTHGSHSNSYTLVLRLADACATFFKREFTFDGHLALQANAMQFTLAQLSELSANAGDLQMDLKQNGTQLSGTLATDASRDRDGYLVTVYERVTNHAPAFVTGTVGSGGRLAGVFDGSVHIAHPSFGLGSGCVASHFSWSLAPSVE